MKIYLGSVAWRQIESGHHQCVVDLFRECDRRGIEIEEGRVIGDALVSRARSIAASAFLRSDCDVMLSIDSDIWFRPEDAIALCEKALAGHDIIGAIYATRSLQTQPALMLANDEEVVFTPESGPKEARFIPTGFTAVTRKPYETLKDTLPHCHQGWGHTAFWPFYMPYCIEWPGDGYIYLSEDWAFCQRAADAGFKLWVDPSIRVGHSGSYMYTLEDLLRPERPLPQPISLQRSPNGNLSAKGVGMVALEIATLPRDVAEHFGYTTPDELKAALQRSSKDLACMWETHTGSEEGFYKRKDVGQAYILDLANWHMKREVSELLMQNLTPKRNAGLRVLDYGAGIGTAALMLADGNQVDCVEPNKVLQDFALDRAHTLERRINFLSVPPAESKYDLAVCVDVLEHVANPEVVAKTVASALKPGGMLFTESDFTNDDGCNPMHHVSEDRLGAHFWEDEGMKRVNKYFWRKPEEVMA